MTQGLYYILIITQLGENIFIFIDLLALSHCLYKDVSLTLLDNAVHCTDSQHILKCLGQYLVSGQNLRFKTRPLNSHDFVV